MEGIRKHIVYPAGLLAVLAIAALGTYAILWGLFFDRLPRLPQPSQGKVVAVAIRGSIAYGTSTQAKALAWSQLIGIILVAALVVVVGGLVFLGDRSFEYISAHANRPELKGKRWARRLGRLAVGAAWSGVALAYLGFAAPPNLPATPSPATGQINKVLVRGQVHYGTTNEQWYAELLDWVPSAMLFGGMELMILATGISFIGVTDAEVKMLGGDQCRLD